MKKLTTLLAALAMVLGLSATAHAITLTATFNSLDELYIGITPVELDPAFDPSVDFVITNNTGLTWTDFHLRETIVWFNPLGPYSYTGSGTETWNLDYSTVDILGLNVLDGFTLQFSISCDGDCSYAGMTFWGTPTIDSGGQQVPEPATILLLGSGLIGLAFFRRKEEV